MLMLIYRTAVTWTSTFQWRLRRGPRRAAPPIWRSPCPFHRVFNARDSVELSRCQVVSDGIWRRCAPTFRTRTAATARPHRTRPGELISSSSHACLAGHGRSGLAPVEPRPQSSGGMLTAARCWMTWMGECMQYAVYPFTRSPHDIYPLQILLLLSPSAHRGAAPAGPSRGSQEARIFAGQQVLATVCPTESPNCSVSLIGNPFARCPRRSRAEWRVAVPVKHWLPRPC